MPSSLNGTGLTFNSGATLNSPPVTSIATGNGLQGGTITTTGTLSIAAPAQNTVGSYAFVFTTSNNTASAPVFGSNYAAGTGTLQIQAGLLQGNNCGFGAGFVAGQISGTWKWLSGNGSSQAGVGLYYSGLAVRVA